MAIGNYGGLGTLLQSSAVSNTILQNTIETRKEEEAKETAKAEEAEQAEETEATQKTEAKEQNQKLLDVHEKLSSKMESILRADKGELESASKDAESLLSQMEGESDDFTAENLQKLRTMSQNAQATIKQNQEQNQQQTRQLNQNEQKDQTQRTQQQTREQVNTTANQVSGRAQQEAVANGRQNAATETQSTRAQSEAKEQKADAAKAQQQSQQAGKTDAAKAQQQSQQAGKTDAAKAQQQSQQAGTTNAAKTQQQQSQQTSKTDAAKAQQQSQQAGKTDAAKAQQQSQQTGTTNAAKAQLELSTNAQQTTTTSTAAPTAQQAVAKPQPGTANSTANTTQQAAANPQSGTQQQIQQQSAQRQQIQQAVQQQNAQAQLLQMDAKAQSGPAAQLREQALLNNAEAKTALAPNKGNTTGTTSASTASLASLAAKTGAGAARSASISSSASSASGASGTTGAMGASGATASGAASAAAASGAGAASLLGEDLALPGQGALNGEPNPADGAQVGAKEQEAPNTSKAVLEQAPKQTGTDKASEQLRQEAAIKADSTSAAPKTTRTNNAQTAAASTAPNKSAETSNKQADSRFTPQALNAKASATSLSGTPNPAGAGNSARNGAAASANSSANATASANARETSSGVSSAAAKAQADKGDIAAIHGQGDTRELFEMLAQAKKEIANSLDQKALTASVLQAEKQGASVLQAEKQNASAAPKAPAAATTQSTSTSSAEASVGATLAGAMVSEAVELEGVPASDGFTTLAVRTLDQSGAAAKMQLQGHRAAPGSPQNRPSPAANKAELAQRVQTQVQDEVFTPTVRRTNSQVFAAQMSGFRPSSTERQTRPSTSFVQSAAPESGRGTASSGISAHAAPSQAVPSQAVPSQAVPSQATLSQGTILNDKLTPNQMVTSVRGRQEERQPVQEVKGFSTPEDGYDLLRARRQQQKAEQGLTTTAKQADSTASATATATAATTATSTKGAGKGSIQVGSLSAKALFESEFGVPSQPTATKIASTELAARSTSAASNTQATATVASRTKGNASTTLTTKVNAVAVPAAQTQAAVASFASIASAASTSIVGNNTANATATQSSGTAASAKASASAGTRGDLGTALRSAVNSVKNGFSKLLGFNRKKESQAATQASVASAKAEATTSKETGGLSKAAMASMLSAMGDAPAPTGAFPGHAMPGVDTETGTLISIVENDATDATVSSVSSEEAEAQRQAEAAEEAESKKAAAAQAAAKERHQTEATTHRASVLRGNHFYASPHSTLFSNIGVSPNLDIMVSYLPYGGYATGVLSLTNLRARLESGIPQGGRPVSSAIPAYSPILDLLYVSKNHRDLEQDSMAIKAALSGSVGTLEPEEYAGQTSQELLNANSQNAKQNALDGTANSLNRETAAKALEKAASTSLHQVQSAKAESANAQRLSESPQRENLMGELGRDRAEQKTRQSGTSSYKGTYSSQSNSQMVNSRNNRGQQQGQQQGQRDQQQAEQQERWGQTDSTKLSQRAQNARQTAAANRGQTTAQNAQRLQAQNSTTEAQRAAMSKMQGQDISLNMQAISRFTELTPVRNLMKRLYDQDRLDEMDEDEALNETLLLFRLCDAETYDRQANVLGFALGIADELGLQDEHLRSELKGGAMLKDLGEVGVYLFQQDDDSIDNISGFLQSKEMRQAALLHNIGEVAIPESIKRKTTQLTAEEYEVLKLHPIIGAEMVYPIESLRYLCPTIRAHHERWDGKGYPDGLHTRDIPLAARILAIADTFETIMTATDCKAAVDPDIARQIINAGRGTHFDPQCVDAFERMISARFPSKQRNKVHIQAAEAQQQLEERLTPSVGQSMGKTVIGAAPQALGAANQAIGAAPQTSGMANQAIGSAPQAASVQSEPAPSHTPAYGATTTPQPDHAPALTPAEIVAEVFADED